MVRIDLARLQVVLFILLLALLFTASLGGVTANNLPPASVNDTAALAAKTKKATKTPDASKTRKPKKTKTAQPTATETETLSATPTATETLSATETVTPTETVASETPAPTETRKAKKTKTPAPDATATVVAVPNQPRYEAFIQASVGGFLAVEEGTLVVNVPARAFAKDATLRFKRILKDKHPADPNTQVVVNRFSLNAIVGKAETTPKAKKQEKKKNKAEGKKAGKKKDKANGVQELTTFDEPITVEIYYDEAMLGSWNEETLQVVYWDETLGRWMPLETSIDTENNVITAETTHFTDFGLSSAPDVQNYLPSIEGFQTDLYTGTSGYSYPLAVPPGVGGLTPRLSLSYSSGGTDLSSSTAQASYVGMGWSLDTSYVARDTHGTRSASDDTYVLSLNGASYDLVQGTNGRYYTNREQYWRIKFINTNQTWEVITNDGTKYVFGETSNGRSYEIRHDEWNNWYTTIYQFSLEKVTDAHGNTIKYTYQHQTDTCSQGTYDISIRPDKIEYNWNGSAYLTNVNFGWSTREDRNVYYPTAQCGPAPYQSKKLDRVSMNTTDGGTMQLVRAYEFTYDYSTFPGVASVRSDGTSYLGRLTLLNIKQLGKDNTSALPLTTFTYNATRLKTGSNGIGGLVRFVYGEEDAGQHNDIYEQDYTAWTCGGSTCTIPSYAFWTKVAGAGYTFDVRKDPLNEWALAYQVPPTSNSNYLRWTVAPFMPNVNYVFTNTLTTSSSNVQVQFRLYDAATGAETNLNTWTSVTPNTAQDFVFTVSLPADVRAPQLRLFAKDTSGANPRLYVEKTILQPLSTHHVVTTKTVEDGLGSSDDWTYTYTGAATNNGTLSPAANQNNPRHPKYSQFRGHSEVTVTDPLGNQTKNVFDQGDYYAGKATEVRQKDGSNNTFTVTFNEYDKRNYATQNLYANTGERIDFIKTISSTVKIYDGNNGATPVTKRSEFSYDDYGNITQTLEYSGSSLYRKTLKEIYPADVTNGAHITNKTARVYVTDASGNLVSDTRYFYDGNGTYNAAPTVGELKKTRVYKDASNYIDSATYAYADGYGNVTSVTDARTNTTSTTFDTQYHIFAETVDPPILTATTNAYDRRMGTLTSTTDPNGAITSTGYDVFGRRTWVKTPLDYGYPATALYTYTLGTTNVPSKVQVSVRRDLGAADSVDYQHAWYFYDGMGRVIQKQTLGLANGAQARIVVVNTKYDTRGKTWRVSQPYYVNVSNGYTGSYQTPSWGANTYFTYEYDAIGRTKKVTNPDGTDVETAYDHWLTTSTDANNHKSDYLADAFGRTTRVREYTGTSTYSLYATTNYTYDVQDRLTQTTDNASNNTTLTYDWLGRKTQMQDPDMGTWTYGYDDAGNMLRQTDARGNSVCFVYDDLNRVTTKTARTGTDCNASVSYTVNYYYDDTTNGNMGLGRRTSMDETPSGNSQTWKYDKQGRVISTAQTINGAPANLYVTEFTYDAMDRVRTMKYPDNETVTQAYNNQGLLQTANGTSNYITASDYNAASQIESLTFGNGAVTDYSYNNQSQRLTNLTTTYSGSTRLNLDYTFDNVGNILTVQDNIGTAGKTTYAYDDLDRLLSATATLSNTYTRSWTYDTIGNTQTRVESGTTNNYTYDANHKHAVAQAGTGKYFCYDANGNMTKRNATNSTCTSGGDSMVYDVENRMTSMTTASGTTDFAYNGDGARVSRTIATGTTYYIGNYYEVWKPAGSATFNKYYYFGSNRVATRINGTLFYMQGDHLGSSSLLMTTGGALQTRQAYFPYGDKRLADGSALPTGMDTTFTGQKSDDSTGLMYYGARYYDTTLGRFTQADTIIPSPMNPQSLNRYTYVLNNPIRYIDPTGHSEEEPPCQSWDNWCWENRYWTAQGKCYNEASEGWTRECAPNIGDPEMLGQVIEENPSVLLRADTQVAFDPTGVVKFIWEQMIRNAQGADAAMLRELNSCSVSGMTCSDQGIAALGYFAFLVQPGGSWDFKSLIRAQFGGRWQEVDGYYYNHDVWGNIHFGYVGLASGFSVATLIQGAGAAEIFTDVRGGIGPVPRIPGEGFTAAYDQARDRAAVLIGMALWLDQGLSVTTNDIVDAIEASPAIGGLYITK